MLLTNGGNPVAGTKQLTTTVAAALSTGLPCKGVIVNNPSTNSANILVGDSAARTIEVPLGTSLTIPTMNVNLVYAANASSATQTIGWLAIL